MMKDGEMLIEGVIKTFMTSFILYYKYFIRSFYISDLST